MESREWIIKNNFNYMTKIYNHQEVEKKWQKKWADAGVYRTGEDKNKPKYYILDMFPYPSGAGLHVGHPKGYIATDIFARMKMMQGFNVLHPMGWDAFGLPAENYALKNKVHPRVATEENVATYKKQLEQLGFSYDWSREIDTTDPKFYKWTQWIFLKMLERGLAFESYEPINWCPSCKTGLANEDLEDGKCERCSSEIEQKPMRQWVLRITDYADRMLQDLDKLTEWDSSIKEMQRNWIGRSEGAEVKFEVRSKKSEVINELKVFTTRPDTLFGCTYMVVAPEHPLIKNYESGIMNYEEVRNYVERAKRKTNMERTELNKEKTGVRLDGLMAINPVNGAEVPIFVADYVMMGYGTGAIMAVPAHDERDFEFAQKYDINIIEVVGGGNITDGAYTNDGVAINSGFLDGLKTQEAKAKMISWLEEKGLGAKRVNYKLQDWVFSRQRYWGEPIPVIHCDICGVVPVPESELPLRLPDVEHYEPSGTGESPLATIADWVNVSCPKCGAPAKRETNTMPQWAGSSWYYLRFIDPENNEALVDAAKEKYWSPVDFYVGGAEHATRHLIYARFWHKFLFDIGAVSYEEPFTRLQHVGLILAEDGRKMSKRWGNVINPDSIVESHGADTMRLYEMFMGPFSQACAWSTSGLSGARKFLERIWRLADKVESDCEDSKEVLNILHKTIKKVGDDILEFKLNTAVSAMMIFINRLEEEERISRSCFISFLQILAPFAPHFCDELWEQLGNTQSVFASSWPEADENLMQDETIKIAVQVNGKVRNVIEVAADTSEDEIKKTALASEAVCKWTDGKEIVKVIYVAGKMVSVVVK